MPANGDVINTEDSEEALEEKEFIETNLSSEYAVDILKSMIKREDNFQPKWNYMTKQVRKLFNCVFTEIIKGFVKLAKSIFFNKRDLKINDFLLILVTMVFCSQNCSDL